MDLTIDNSEWAQVTILESGTADSVCGHKLPDLHKIHAFRCNPLHTKPGTHNSKNIKWFIHE